MALKREDYYAVARVLAKLPNSPDKYEAIEVLTHLFQRDNPLFSEELFYDYSEEVYESDSQPIQVHQTASPTPDLPQPLPESQPEVPGQAPTVAAATGQGRNQAIHRSPPVRGCQAEIHRIR